MHTTSFLGLALFCAVAGESTAADFEQPWQHAQAVLDAATQNANTQGGIRGIENQVSDLEMELAKAVPSLSPIGINDDEAIVLTDGPAQILMLAAIERSTKFKKLTAVADPYPLISLYLGSYYNEIGKPDNALRVLNAGIAVTDTDGLGLGEHDSLLVSEKGAALNALKRFDDSLATYTGGLKLASDTDPDKARMYRGMGFALTELGRLDDAESAYRKSLMCEPGNAHAANELQYIAQLRTGKAPTSGVLQTTLPPSNPPSNAATCPNE
jgi:tetratricopeptide (TPR) repeat protein